MCLCGNFKKLPHSELCQHCWQPNIINDNDGLAYLRSIFGMKD